MVKFFGLIFLVFLVLWLNFERGYRKGYIRIRVAQTFSLKRDMTSIVEMLEERGKVASYEGDGVFWIDHVYYRITKSRFRKGVVILKPE